MLVIAVVLLLLLTEKHDDIKRNRTVFYYDEATTSSAVESFDLRNYDKFEVDIHTSPAGDYLYTTCVCQADCMLPVKSHINTFISDAHTPQEIKDIPGYLISGSEINFSFRPPNESTTIMLHIYFDSDCRDIVCNLKNACEPKFRFIPKALDSSNNFTYTHLIKRDEYTCFGVKFGDRGSYAYSVNGTVMQYQNVTYMNESGLCDLSHCQECHTNENCSSTHNLSRPIELRTGPRPKDTCIYTTVSNSAYGLTFNVSTVVSYTSENINFITPLVVGSVLLVIFVPIAVVSLIIAHRKCYLL